MNFKISTLTPVHIGNGIELQGNFEYLNFREEKKIALINAEKVLAILGEDNLHHWISCIDQNQPLLPLLKQRKPNLTSNDIADRIIHMSVATEKPIRTQIHTGCEMPLIPGSSLKGAIRTALFAELIFDNPESVTTSRNLKDYRNNWNDKIINNLIFGNDPNHDIFRLLQVGDVEFTNTVAFETNVINKYNTTWKIKQELSQVVETIPAGLTAKSRIQFNDLLLKRAGTNYFNRNSTKLKFDQLLSLINNHTMRLVEDEIDYWDNKAQNPEALGDYLDEMNLILESIQNCTETECVLRLGWGSGFRSMTGDWHMEMTDNDYYDMVKSIRRGHPADLVFPKTTRFVKGGVPLGFLKLSI
jgi:CRISPR-associated protein Csm5